MRLDDLDPSENVRDLGRGGGGGGAGLGGLLGLLPLFLGRGKMGCGGIALLLIVGAAYLFMSGGGGLLTSGGAPSATQATGPGTACDTAEELFACRVLVSTEQTWGPVFQRAGATYPQPTLSFYQQNGQSGCGAAMSAMGPFYCPSDNNIYLDTDFFRELQTKFGAAGDFAQAYVIAHEVGHHIQTVDGTIPRVQQQQARVSEDQGNALQVRVELQADCYAGVWAALNRDRLEPGDIEEGMTAAAAIGDDTLQKQSQGRVVPESFTHGSSAQRQAWLRKGLETGNPAACDTFSGAI